MLGTGTNDSLHDASLFARTIERRQELKICAPRKGFPDPERARVTATVTCGVAFEAGWLSTNAVDNRANIFGQISCAAYIRRRAAEIGGD